MKRRSHARTLGTAIYGVVCIPWAQPSINLISFSLHFHSLKEGKCSKPDLLQGSVSGCLATGSVYSSLTIRNIQGWSHSPSDISNLSMCGQLKACFRRGILRTGILWSICRPCFNGSCLSNKRCYTGCQMKTPQGVSAFVVFTVRKCCGALLLLVLVGCSLSFPSRT